MQSILGVLKKSVKCFDWFYKRKATLKTIGKYLMSKHRKPLSISLYSFLKNGFIGYIAHINNAAANDKH